MAGARPVSTGICPLAVGRISPKPKRASMRKLESTIAARLARR